MPDSTTKTFEFQAEIKQLLDIVVHSLYTEKEIFVRELVSNGSDALEKLRHLKLTEKEIFDDHLELEINITTDDKAKTFTIQDFGWGRPGRARGKPGRDHQLRLQGLREGAGRGRPEGRGPDRAVRRRASLGLHGGEDREGLHPFLADRRAGARLVQRRRRKLRHRGERRRAAGLEDRRRIEGRVLQFCEEWRMKE